MLRLVPCPSCKRHVFSREAACPHCRMSGPSFVAMVTLAATLGASGCERDDPPRPAAVGVYGPAAFDASARVAASQPPASAQPSPSTSAEPPAATETAPSR